MGNKKAFIIESRIIMDYLDREFSSIAKCGPLYEDDPLLRSHQEMIMNKGDSLAQVLYAVLLSRGQLESANGQLLKALDFLNMQLAQSETAFFLSRENPSMVDLYIFPFSSRLFYLKGSVLEEEMYGKLDLEARYPQLYRWHKEMRARSELNDGKAIIPINAFHNWLVELKPMELGKKPPLRLPTKL